MTGWNGALRGLFFGFLAFKSVQCKENGLVPPPNPCEIVCLCPECGWLLRSLLWKNERQVSVLCGTHPGDQITDALVLSLWMRCSSYTWAWFSENKHLPLNSGKDLYTGRGGAVLMRRNNNQCMQTRKKTEFLARTRSLIALSTPLLKPHHQSASLSHSHHNSAPNRDILGKTRFHISSSVGHWCRWVPLYPHSLKSKLTSIQGVLDTTPQIPMTQCYSGR